MAMITSPADRRMVTRPDLRDQLPSGRTTFRAKAWGASGITRVDCGLGDSEWQPMNFSASEQVWTLDSEIPGGAFQVCVRATDRAGATGFDSIEAISTVDETQKRRADGSDRDSISAWEEKHIMGTQFGPNRNGRKW